MELYDLNVAKVMDFMKESGYGASSKSLHKLCYKAFRDYLVETHLTYSQEVAAKWLESNKDTWIYRNYTGYRHCLEQLGDIYESGNVLPDHMGPQKPNYSLLCKRLRCEVDEYLDYALSQGISSSDIPRRRIACARFMVYLQCKGLTSIAQINYSLLLSFHEDDYHKSFKSKDVYEDLIRAMLRYFVSIGKCKIGHSLVLSKLLIHQVIKDPSFIAGVTDSRTINGKNDDLWNGIGKFLACLREERYGVTVIKSSKHTLTLLYIFLDMHGISLSEELAWIWFDEVKPLLRTNLKQAMRTLNQFLRFIETGEIYTAVTGKHDHKSSMELLPDWCRRKLMDFLELRRLEGMEKSTLTMYRSSIVRFCTYLISQSISDFNNVMPKTLQDFNAADRHSSTEGKSAYNSRIRNFILYLNDINVIENHLLYKALPTITAPKTRIVNVLGNDEIESIATYGTEHDSPIALRDYAMIVIGLKMGLRASDIVALTFKDVNWKNKSISIIQKKTGKALMLPLPVNVGNAIYKYVKYGRPESDDIHIFINHCAPYGRLGTSVCGSALKRILPDRNQLGSGFHVVRKTFATNLLRGNSRISLISDTLGHRTDGTVHKYLSLDEERMTECPLSLNIAGIAWAGGDF